MDGNVDRQLNRQSENVLEGSVTNTLPTRQDTAQHSDGECKCLGQHLEGRPSDFVSDLQDVMCEGVLNVTGPKCAIFSS